MLPSKSCFLCLFVCVFVSSGQPVFGDQATLSADEIISVLSNGTDMLQYEQALKSLASLSSEQQRDVWHSVLEQTQHEYLAASAAAAILNEGSEESTELIATKIADWSDANRRMVLKAVAYRNDPSPFLPIPRAIFSDLVDDGTSGELAHPLNNSIDVAAMLLAESDDPEDTTLLKQAVQVFSASPGLWLALAEMDAVDTADLPLALATYLDADQPTLLRVAAAIAAAPHNEAAKDFAMTQIGDFLTTFGGQDADAMIAQAMSGDTTIYSEFMKNRPLVGMLRALQTPEAETLTTQALTVGNKIIRMGAAIVATKRWPDKVMQLEQGNFTDMEFALLKANLAKHNAEYHDDIQQQIPQQN